MSAEPRLQIRSNTLIQYNLCPEHFKRLPESGRLPMGFYTIDEDTGEITRNAYSGTLTKGATKRIRKSIELLCQAAIEHGYIKNPVNGKYQPFHLTFCTLTFPDDEQIPAAEATKRCLEPFLRWMRIKWNCDMYIWKAELQKRGQLHYHITSNCFIPFAEVRKKWNELQKAAGYLDNFYNKFGHHNPPGTEIKSVKNKKDLVGYIQKEIAANYTIVEEATKDYQNTDELKQKLSVFGKVWDCSLNLKAYDYCTVPFAGTTKENVCQMVDDGELEMIETDHCTIFKTKRDKKGKLRPAWQVLSDYDRRIYNGLMYDIRCRAVRKPPKAPDDIGESPPTMQILAFTPQIDLFSAS